MRRDQSYPLSHEREFSLKLWHGTLNPSMYPGSLRDCAAFECLFIEDLLTGGFEMVERLGMDWMGGWIRDEVVV